MRWLTRCLVNEVVDGVVHKVVDRVVHKVFN